MKTTSRSEVVVARDHAPFVMPGSPLLGSWGPSCLRWNTRAAMVTLLLTPVLEALERDLAVHGVLHPTLCVLSRNPRNLSKSSGADTDGFMFARTRNPRAHQSDARGNTVSIWICLGTT